MDQKEGPVCRIESIEKKKEKKNPPLLYNLAELQNDCSKRFKISPDETLRIVAATNENLERAIKEGRFREDLYHRLAEMEIRMPSLAECADDILPLAEFFRERFSKELKKETKGFSKDAIYRLRSYRWPGNVRELQNRIKRAVLLTETPVLELPDLNADSQTDIRITEKTPDILPLKDENSEREAIANALQACNGHREQTARLLNVNSSTLYRKMKKYGIR